MTQTCEKCEGKGREVTENTSITGSITECSECHGNGFTGEKEVVEVVEEETILARKDDIEEVVVEVTEEISEEEVV